MDLCHEDNLRLNVLLANKPLAIRIDEGKLLVQGLMRAGESTVRLNPNARPDQYLRRVRELISGHVLGSPGGYPVYLSRWTRMGQMRDESLAQLLLLGEPEAVVAAVCSPGLTDELARRAWWAMEDAGNARRMLRNPGISRSHIGGILADYLVDYLPFETDPVEIMETVRLVLQPGLLDLERRLDLWRKSARRQAYLVGFLRALPDDLPEQAPARALSETVRDLARADNGCAAMLEHVYCAAGQTYLRTVTAVLAKPPCQEVVIATLDCLRDYFSAMRPVGDPDLTLDALCADARAFVVSDPAAPMLAEVIGRCPSLIPEIAAMRFLSGLGYGVIRPLLPDPSTLGSLMRRKLAPAMVAIQQHLDLLLGAHD